MTRYNAMMCYIGLLDKLVIKLFKRSYPCTAYWIGGMWRWETIMCRQIRRSGLYSVCIRDDSEHLVYYTIHGF